MLTPQSGRQVRESGTWTPSRVFSCASARHRYLGRLTTLYLLSYRDRIDGIVEMKSIRSLPNDALTSVFIVDTVSTFQRMLCPLCSL